MELQKRLMNACGVFDLSENEQLEVTFLNIAGESIEAMGFILDRTKPWKISYFDVDEVKEEVIDVYHFFLQFLAITDLYSYLSSESFGEIAIQSDNVVILKDNLMNSGEEALKYARWFLPYELERFAYHQWDRFLSIFFSLDMTPEDVDRIYREKNARNFERIKEKLNATN
jgi:hypothetical protein